MARYRNLMISLHSSELVPQIDWNNRHHIVPMAPWIRASCILSSFIHDRQFMYGSRPISTSALLSGVSGDSRDTFGGLKSCLLQTLLDITLQRGLILSIDAISVSIFETCIPLQAQITR